MLNLTSLRVLWEARRDDLRRLHAQVDGAVLIDELLREVSSLCESQSLQPVTLAEASSPSLYSGVDNVSQPRAEARRVGLSRRATRVDPLIALRD